MVCRELVYHIVVILNDYILLVKPWWLFFCGGTGIRYAPRIIIRNTAGPSARMRMPVQCIVWKCGLLVVHRTGFSETAEPRCKAPSASALTGLPGEECHYFSYARREANVAYRGEHVLIGQPRDVSSKTAASRHRPKTMSDASLTTLLKTKYDQLPHDSSGSTVTIRLRQRAG